MSRSPLSRATRGRFFRKNERDKSTNEGDCVGAGLVHHGAQKTAARRTILTPQSAACAPNWAQSAHVGNGARGAEFFCDPKRREGRVASIAGAPQCACDVLQCSVLHRAASLVWSGPPREGAHRVVDAEPAPDDDVEPTCRQDAPHKRQDVHNSRRAHPDGVALHST